VTRDAPPPREGEESTKQQLQLAVAQGEALQRALDAMDEVRVELASFMRHDHENGRRYNEPVSVDFDGIEIEPARKRA
jgi:hypothetical protein